MSKRAEQKALEVYPISRLPFFPGSEASYDTNEEKRMVYKGGYEQAEKDMKERFIQFVHRHYPINYTGWIQDFKKAMEDEKIIKNILFVLESYVSKSESASSPSLITTYPTYYKEIDWLKSLRSNKQY